MEFDVAVRRDGKSREHQAPGNCDVVSNAFCSRTADASNIYSDERMIYVQAIFHNV